MPVVSAVVLSMLLLAVTGCATSSPPPAAKQETGKKASTVKPAKHNEEKSMNEESQNAVRQGWNPCASGCNKCIPFPLCEWGFIGLPLLASSQFHTSFTRVAWSILECASPSTS